MNLLGELKEVSLVNSEEKYTLKAILSRAKDLGIQIFDPLDSSSTEEEEEEEEGEGEDEECSDMGEQNDKVQQADGLYDDTVIVRDRCVTVPPT